MRRITLSPVASLALPDFTSLFNNDYDFLKKVMEYKNVF
jgi:hypothetical protein